MKTINFRFFHGGDHDYLQIFSIKCEVLLAGERTVGRGDAWDLRTAKQKAFGEAVERLSLKSKFPIYLNIDRPQNSNGIAFHYDHGVAKKLAYAELVEREGVLRAWSTNSPLYFYNLSSVHGTLPRRVLPVITFLNSRALSVTVLNFGEFDGLKILGVNIGGNSPPYNIFGFSASDTYARALEKSLLEALVLYENFSTLKKISVKHSDYDKENKFLGNLLYYGENRARLDEIFPGAILTKEIKKIKPLSLSTNFSHRFYDLKGIGIPGYIARCLNSDFCKFEGGELISSLNSRSQGEFHPIG